MKIYDTHDALLLDVEVDDSSCRYRALMQKPQMALKFSLPRYIEIPVGAWCEYQGEIYYLNAPQNIKKNGTRNIEYTLNMGTVQDKMSLYKMRNSVDKRLKYSMHAKPHEFIEEIIANLNERMGANKWKVGECVQSTEKTIEFNHTNVDAALSHVAEAFETEWEIVDTTIHLHKVEYFKDDPLPLSYGKGNGFIPGVGRTTPSNELPIKRLYVQGGDRNIDRSKYNNVPYLLLPKSQSIGYDGSYFSDESGYDTTKGHTYTSDSDGYYIYRSDKISDAVKEDSIDCSEHYPSRIGTVSSIIAVNPEKNFYDIIDNTIPANLNFNDYIIDGETPTIVFQSGMLSGEKEFEFKYKHLERRFELVPQEIDGITMPNSTFIPAVGNTYAIFGIMLPDSYICDNIAKSGASWDMMREAVKHLWKNENQKFTFKGTLQSLYAKRNWVNIGGKLKVGSYIHFSDTQFAKEGVDIRITGIKDFLTNPYAPVVEISNNVSGQSLTSKLREIDAQEIVIADNHRNALQFTKRRFRDAKETMAMLEQSLMQEFTNSIKPITVETMAMLVGDESLQFRFVATADSTTAIGHTFYYDNVHREFKTEGGIIQHMTLGIQTLSSQHEPSEYKVWSIPKFTSAPLDDGSKRYYLYIKAKSVGRDGMFILSEKAIKMEEVENYYHFLVGVLNSEYDGERSFTPLYGFTEIMPGRITTDSIVSGDGNSYFDMANNALRLGSALDFNSKGDGKLRLRGTLVQNVGGEESPIGCYRGFWDKTAPYFNGDEVLYLNNGTTSTYRYINVVPSKGHTPTETVYWQVMAAGVKGDAGNYTELRFAKNGSATIPPALDASALEPSGWTTSVQIAKQGEYIWCTRAIKTGDGLKLVSPWSTPFRMTPYDGKDGNNGESPVMVYRGVYDNGKTYYGNRNRLDCVKQGNEYYITRIDAGTFSAIVPPNPKTWNVFGASFESIATNLLLAEGANIGDWSIENGKIVSTLDNGVVNRNKIVLDAINKKIEIKSPMPQAGFLMNAESMGNNIMIDAKTGVIEMRSNTNPNIVSYMNAQGFFANRAGIRCVTPSTGLDRRAAIVGLGRGSLNRPTLGDMDDRFIAGVYGEASNTGTAPSYGGYFKHLKASGLVLNTQYVTEQQANINDDTSLVIGMRSDYSAIVLPHGTRHGQIIFFKQLGTGKMRLSASQGQHTYINGVMDGIIELSGSGTGSAVFVRFAKPNGPLLDAWLIG